MTDLEIDKVTTLASLSRERHLPYPYERLQKNKLADLKIDEVSTDTSLSNLPPKEQRWLNSG